MSVYSGKEGSLKVVLNSWNYDDIDQALYFQVQERHGLRPVATTTLGLHEAKNLQAELGKLIRAFEDNKPKTRVETIRDYPVGTRFTAGTYYSDDYLRIGGDKVVAITSGKTYSVGSFLNELGTKDLKVVT